ncbi:TTL-domain-containing protein [Sistotremastrum suecicum HHB10207 ss-3]|uniref:TTL-domain-containing protein n=1 Tax=Sistotremastrum suecicum HHB10207 ss-3 TaxID=1314776 RepID=A0A166J5C2_9AGAM|nr:TTL-domain-containing protein [Sistotremastrum suecicum HHB10207 ss-3]
MAVPEESLALITFPTAPLTEWLIRRALGLVLPNITITSLPADFASSPNGVLQWAAYDSINHELTLYNKRVLASALIIRKALIRKHFLAGITEAYVKKRPQSILRAAVPRTWHVEIAFADELDELWTDDLYDLSEILDAGETDHVSRKWWILKPSMADAGMDIHLFDTKAKLRGIIEGFDPTDSGSYEDDDDDDAGHLLSQLRHFVIQEYISDPVLIDPRQPKAPLPDHHENFHGHKFHIRAYCVVRGALDVFLYEKPLALFAPAPYASLPTADSGVQDIPLSYEGHLTNTSLQKEEDSTYVKLLEELQGNIDDYGHTVLASDVSDLLDQMATILTETFQAAVDTPVHFQPLPNAFELFGVDFLVSHVASDNGGSSERYKASLLEFNAEPAIEKTGLRLRWILEELFVGIAQVSVRPFLEGDSPEPWEIGVVKHGLRKCSSLQVRSS